MNANRNEKGEVTIELGDEPITATVPQNMSMLGIFGVNGIIDKGIYKEDGWVHINGIKHRKWHIMYDDIRLWEPRLNDSISLYNLWKKTKDACNLKYDERWNVVQEIIATGNKKDNRYIAHAAPLHYSDINPDAWWEYRISRHHDEWMYSFEWLDEKPKPLINHNLGKKLYLLEQRCDTLGARQFKVEKIFFKSLRKYLPKNPTEEQILSLTFNDDIFVFQAISHGNYYAWKQQPRINKITTQKII